MAGTALAIPLSILRCLQVFCETCSQRFLVLIILPLRGQTLFSICSHVAYSTYYLRLPLLTIVLYSISTKIEHSYKYNYTGGTGVQWACARGSRLLHNRPVSGYEIETGASLVPRPFRKRIDLRMRGAFLPFSPPAHAYMFAEGSGNQTRLEFAHKYSLVPRPQTHPRSQR